MQLPLRSAVVVAGLAGSVAAGGGRTSRPQQPSAELFTWSTVAQASAAPHTDADRRTLMARLAALSADSMEGRLSGSPGGKRARKWIERELQSIGVRPMGASYEQPVHLERRAGADTLGANIIARVPGSNPAASVIVLSAHYDHLGIKGGNIYNGADDNASGCVALITIAERLSRTPISHDVLLVFFDAEESDLVGSHAFIALPPIPLRRIAIDINLDMVSRADGGALWVSGLLHYPFLRGTVQPLVSRASIPIRLGHDTAGVKPGDDWTESSDHGSFYDKGIPFLYLGVEDHVDYHRPSDDADKVKPAFYSGAVGFAEALLRAVDSSMAGYPVRKF